MKKKNSRKQKSAKRAAARVTQILADPTTPTILRDTLEDMLCEVGDATGVGITTPAVARVAMSRMFRVAEDGGLRQFAGVITRDAAVVGNANN